MIRPFQRWNYWYSWNFDTEADILCRYFKWWNDWSSKFKEKRSISAIIKIGHLAPRGHSKFFFHNQRIHHWLKNVVGSHHLVSRLRLGKNSLENCACIDTLYQTATATLILSMHGRMHRGHSCVKTHQAQIHRN